MANDYDESIRQQHRLTEQGIAIRVVRRDETYSVEYTRIRDDLNTVDERGFVEDRWQVFGGSVGYGDSTFTTEDNALEFYYDLIDFNESELAEKYSDFWVGEQKTTETDPITDRTHLTIESEVAEMPDADSEPQAYEQIVHAVTDAVNGALYEHGSVGHDTRVQSGETDTNRPSKSSSGSAPEMTPRLSQTDYEAEIETLAERMLHRLADDDTGALMAVDEIEIRPILSETEVFHAQYPFSAIEHGESEPTPGAWNWIEDGVPKESLRRQALDIVAGDVYKRVEQLAQSREHTYREDETTYVRKTSNQSETENTTEKDENSTDSTNDTTDNPAVDEHAPEWELPTDETGEPDYEAAVEEIGLEYDQLFTIDTEYYRYRGRRHDDLVVAPETEYGEVVEDCLPVAVVWAAYCEGRIGHGPPLTGHGMIRGVTNATGDSHIGLQPSDWDTDSSFARIGLEHVPERGAFFIDYRYGEDLPTLTLYDATEDDRPAYQFLLPTREHPTVQLVCDRTTDLAESLPEVVRRRIESDSDTKSDGANR
jgi:hypothetical protein